jgi:hypothetical protein
MIPAGWLRGSFAVLASFVVLGGLAWAADDATWKSKLDALRKERAKESKTSKKKGSAVAVTPSEYPWATPDDTHYVDKMLEAEWKALGFPVASECSDGEFIRRASLDIIGRIPTVQEIETFVKDRGADRRTKLVNRLLASPEYGKNWATVWTHLCLPNGRDAGNMQDVNPKAFHAWLETQFNKNVGWDKIVAEMLSATGRWDENPAVNFAIGNMMQGNSIQLTSFTSRLFLGVQTQCTECHDHPWNDWKQDQFHGINAFFATTRERRATTTLASGMVATDYYELNETPVTPREAAQKGVTFERRSGLVSYIMPTYLDGRDVVAIARGKKATGASAGEETVEDFLAKQKESGDEEIYLRKELTKVIVAKDNPYFARAIVNRLWHHYMGHSFIRNVDDFDNGQDEPSMPDLLNKLTEDFKVHNYDLKRLTRWICTCKAYSLGSRHRGKENKDAQGFFTTMIVKPLTPDQLYDSLLTLTEIHRAGKSENTEGERRQFREEFRRTFGQDIEQTGAPKFNGTITQSLMLMNSPIINRATTASPGTMLYRVAASNAGSSDKVDALYMAALARKPSGSEKNLLGQMRQRSKNEKEFLEDVLWMIVNSGEFVHNY